MQYDVDEKLIRRVVRELLAGGDPIEDDTYLPDAGLDSIGIVQLFVALEDGLGITFPDEALTLDNFGSVVNIVRLVTEIRLNERLTG